MVYRWAFDPAIPFASLDFLMFPSLPARFTAPEMRTGFYYTAMYLPVGIASLLLPIWLDGQGIDEEQIGIINATPILVMIVLNLFVGRVADRAKDWRSAIMAGSLVSAVVSLGFLFVDDFWGVLIVNTLLITPFLAIEPVIDAAAVRMTRRRGSDFARVRVWGSFGYIGATALAGWLLGWLGIAVFVPLLVATALLRGGASFALPFFRAPDGLEATAPPLALSPDTATTIKQVILRPWFILTLSGTALLQASHMMLISFGALIWIRNGVPEAAIGMLWIVGPVSEIITMLYFARFSRRFSARHLLLAACMAGAVRWTGMVFATELWQFAVLQCLHMMTFGLAYMGIVNFIANWTSEDIAAEAQSFYTVMRQGASVAALLVFGPLVGNFGANGYYAAALMSGVGGIMVFTSLAIKEIKSQS